MRQIHRLRWPAFARAALCLALLTGAAGCLADVGGDGESGPQAVKSALDNDVPDGTACYQDVPMRKGTMSYGVCCFDDPVAGTSECIVCDKAHNCTPGGAEPGCFTGVCNTAALGVLQATPVTTAPAPIVSPVTRYTTLAR